MKRKTFAIIVVGLLIGTSVIVAAASTNDVNIPSMISNEISNRLQLRKNSAENSNQYTVRNNQNRVRERNTNYIEDSIFNDLNEVKYKKITGQWGYVNNPKAIGQIEGSFSANVLKGYLIEEDQKLVIRIEFQRNTFSGQIYYNNNQNEASSNTQLAVMSFSGRYSINNGYLTAFWSKDPIQPTTSSVAPIYDGWFFGEII